MSEELLKNLSLALSLVVIVPLFVAVFRRKQLTEIQRSLSYLIIVLVAVEFSAYLLWSNKLNNHPIYHFYSIAEFILILNIYKTKLGAWFSQKMAYILGFGFSLFAIGNMIFLQNLSEFNSNVTTASGALIILTTLLSFYQLLRGPTYSTLQLNPLFWINSGLLIYFSSNLILFYLSNRIDLTRDESLTIWGVHSVFNCILILFYTIALWIQPPKE